jgi:hypothetical protein
MFRMAWNKQKRGTDIDDPSRLVGEYLPKGWRATVRRSRREGPDGELEIRAPDGTTSAFTFEKRRSLEPRRVSAAVLRLGEAGRGRPLLFLAPFFSPRTRELLADAGASYVDSTGNVRLVLARPGLFVQAQGSDKDPGVEPRSLRSLKGPTAGRVVRALCDLPTPVGVRELAEKASIPLGSVARVVGLLDREALVVRDEGGRIARVLRVDLVRRWARDYGLQTSNAALGCLAPRGVNTMLAQLPRLDGYAITGSLAAARRISLAPPRLATLFVGNPRQAAEALGLLPADAGTNALLLRPYDRVVFERTWSEEGNVFASLSQVAADLLTSPGRAPSEGEELLRWMAEHVDGWQS